MPEITNEMMMDGMTWMHGGDTGLSSEAMMCAVLGISQNTHFPNSHPIDPSDLGRCLRLIKKLPWAKGALPILAGRCPVWKRLADAWDELDVMMCGEVGIDWEKGQRAPATYAAMKRLINQGKAAYVAIVHKSPLHHERIRHYNL